MNTPTQLASFAAGCFWGVEEEFRTTPGVLNTTVGYAGGHVEHPTYEEVCTNSTGHAETVLVEYDPAIIAYEKLLERFWGLHDPTSVNRQGPDVGSQYRSVIFYHTPEQKTAAERSKSALDASGKFPKPIATEIVPAGQFWKAEE